MTFSECVLECTKNKELIAEFDRLNGTNLSLRGSNLDLQIDIACGRMEQEIPKFLTFVKECVWDRLPVEEKT